MAEQITMAEYKIKKQAGWTEVELYEAVRQALTKGLGRTKTDGVGVIRIELSLFED